MENVSFDYFKQIELRVAEIKTCDDVEGVLPVTVCNK